MKKLAVLLIVILLGVFFINSLYDLSKAGEQTLGAVVADLQNSMSKFKADDITTLNSKITPEELTDSAKLVTQWKALLKVSEEARKIVSKR